MAWQSSQHLKALEVIRQGNYAEKGCEIAAPQIKGENGGEIIHSAPFAASILDLEADKILRGKTIKLL
jgi:hypothetical protein